MAMSSLNRAKRLVKQTPALMQIWRSGCCARAHAIAA